MLFPLIKGFSVSGGLIIAIGAQNAFVIRQGLKRQHLLLTALVCSCIDAILIALGVIGIGQYIVEYGWLIEITKYLAAVFLFAYGALALRSACKTTSMQVSSEDKKIVSAKVIFFSLLALSLLNPHVYLDTVILLGSIASQHPAPERVYFAVGAIVASFSWFFAITYGAKLLAPLLRKKNCWRVIDGCIAITMWIIAISLFL
jgi:L-lysine exporter family protein LysE/ArgO